MLKNFNNTYKPSANCEIASAEIIREYAGKVPDLLIDLWKTSGFGKYNNGLIELINPKDFEPSLWTWMGKEVSNYVPIAITGFGELFYYRKLSDTEEDVCIIDIQYRNIETLNWSLESFFEDFLISDVERNLWLRQDLFELAIELKGELLKNEVFTFSPILAFGGAEEVEFLEKGNAQVYQHIVFQITS